MTKNISQNGFTTIELLITLFIAAAFLMSGYQMYMLIIGNSAETRTQVKATNLAYDYLQRNKLNLPAYCTASSSTVTPSSTESDGLVNATINIALSCPYPLTPSVTKVAITVNYGSDNPQKEISEATYATSN